MSMVQAYDANQRKHIQRQLKRPGEKLDDAVVINVLYLLNQLHSTMRFSIVDPLFRPNRSERWVPIVKQLLVRPQVDDVILLPLVLSNHWSLLVFIPSLSGYMHFDSIEGLHRGYVRQILALLNEDGDTGFQELPVHHSADQSQQTSDWECGYFLLMNSFLFFHCKKEALASEDTLRLYLSRHCSAVNEKNVNRFARKIYDIVSSPI
jgi:hypothetical protein